MGREGGLKRQVRKPFSGGQIICIYSGVSVLIMKLRSQVINSISSYFGWRKGGDLAYSQPTLQNFNHSLRRTRPKVLQLAGVGAKPKDAGIATVLRASVALRNIAVSNVYRA
ncbi:uncharacterized protein K444DRAFT_24498 [Hyaloscypha bicolor E]|uniref:Uncharacterized protein n=1 Tax=Hyaloscypha bicolor E TaxID=1095630 RepID=A0A2J6T4D8_9HELO|nr:uncharacterized protein K444DRAFT_24498 [Hyaloscypha bicolor E]PMD57793.1 hypothetical protein K444DRAFT_24498 [Hyaloscypha bicolor E]